MNGRFIWHDLMTNDTAKAEAFYGALLGWTFQHHKMGDGGEYIEFKTANGTQGGGIMAFDKGPSMWGGYVTTDDVEGCCARAAESGGKVIMPPMDMPNVGKWAVLMDGQGGVTYAFKTTNIPPEVEATKIPLGSICWDELHTSDPVAAAKFYATLYGWTYKEQEMGPMGTYRVATANDKQRGGIVKMMPGAKSTMWLSYFLVDDIEKAHKKALSLGAKELVAPNDIPGVGRSSVIADPTGAVISLYKDRNMA